MDLQGDTVLIRSSQTVLRIFILHVEPRDTAVHRVRVQTRDGFSCFSHFSLILQKGNPNFRVLVTNRIILKLRNIPYVRNTSRPNLVFQLVEDRGISCVFMLQSCVWHCCS
jgi:hypothetical protein